MANLFGAPMQNPVFAQQAQDPRQLLAQSLIAGGANARPVNTPIEGIARLGSALAGALIARNVGQEYKQRGENYNQTLAQALQASQPWKAPDNIMSAPPDTLQQGLGPMPARPDDPNARVVVPQGQNAPGTGGMEALAAALRGNPDTAPMAMQMQFDQFGRQNALQDALALNRGNKDIDLEYGPRMQAALIPGKVDEARQLGGVQTDVTANTARTVGPIENQNAADRFKIIAPMQTEQAVSQANALIEPGARAAGANAAATFPYDVAKSRAGAQATADAQAPNKVFDREEGLRREFTGLPEVKAWKDILPAIDSARNAADTKAGDLNIVYALAKTFDPGSVVREGEQLLVNNAASLGQRVMGLINEVGGGGRLTASQRSDLLNELERRAGTWERQYITARNQYTDIAKRGDVSIDNILGPQMVAQPRGGAPQSAGTSPTPGGQRAMFNNRLIVPRGGVWVYEDTGETAQ